MSRAPSLADDIAVGALTDRDGRPIASAMRQIVRDARRYRFDEEAADRLQEIIGAAHTMLLEQQQFARPPYNHTWIEWPGVPLNLRGVEVTRHAVLVYERDQHIGAIMHAETPSGLVTLTPQIHLAEAWTLTEAIELAGLPKQASARDLDSFLYQGLPPPFGMTFPQRTRLLLANRVQPLAGWLDPDTDYGFQARGLIKAGIFAALETTAALLLIGRHRNTIFISDEPAERRFHRNKVRPYLSQSIVSIALDPPRIIRRLRAQSGEAVPQPAQEYPGHWRHDLNWRNGSRQGCVHEPSEDRAWDDNPLHWDHWVCARCGGKRWRVYSYTRGDATVGFRGRRYDVTTDLGRRRERHARRIRTPAYVAADMVNQHGTQRGAYP